MIFDSAAYDEREGAEMTQSQEAGTFEGVNSTIEFDVSETSFILAYSDVSSDDEDAVDVSVSSELDAPMAMHRSSSTPSLQSTKTQESQRSSTSRWSTKTQVSQPSIISLRSKDTHNSRRSFISMPVADQEQDESASLQSKGNQGSWRHFKWPSFKRRGSSSSGDEPVFPRPEQSAWAASSTGGSSRRATAFHAVTPASGSDTHAAGANAAPQGQDVRPDDDQEGHLASEHAGSSSGSHRFQFRGFTGSFFGKTRVVAFDQTTQGQ